jgi:hypothetical protein
VKINVFKPSEVHELQTSVSETLRQGITANICKQFAKRGKTPGFRLLT